MDTRSKIVEAAPEDSDIVEGFFDPLLASHAVQIARSRNSRPLTVVVRDPERPLLDARARAELVAGLRAVDYVVIGGLSRGPALAEDPESLMAAIRAKHGR
jgi:bifunctional ADP-heptose synthase (sugar kinase/adenylyltransferase)